MTLFINSLSIYYIPHRDHINKTDQKSYPYKTYFIAAIFVCELIILYIR